MTKGMERAANMIADKTRMVRRTAPHRAWRFRKMKVTAVHNDYTVNLLLPGEESLETRNVRVLSGTMPRVGANLWVATDGAALIGLGAPAGSGQGNYAPRVQAGQVTLTVNNASEVERAVTFDYAFPSAPRVVATADYTLAFWVCGVASVSATGFTLKVKQRAAGLYTGSVPVDWIAVGGWT